jgi:hypothetical protein
MAFIICSSQHLPPCKTLNYCKVISLIYQQLTQGKSFSYELLSINGQMNFSEGFSKFY